MTFWFVFLKADNFPRFLLLFLPWIAIAAAWALDRILALAAARAIAPKWVIVPFFLYLGAFVFDGERVFWHDPHNPAEQWLFDNVKKGTPISYITFQGGDEPSSFSNVGYPFAGELGGAAKPEIVVCEMHYANWFLSGMSWRNSFPRDNTTVFPWFTFKSLPAWHALFEGRAQYR